MKILNRKRVLSFLLALAMIVSLVPSNVFTIFAAEAEGEETTTETPVVNEDELSANVGKQAVFDWHPNFLFVDDPTRSDIEAIYWTDTETAHTDGVNYWYRYDEGFVEATDENGDITYVSSGEPFINAKGIVLKLGEYYYDSENGYHWYRVSCDAPSDELAAVLATKNWLLFATDNNIEYGFTPYLAVYDADETIRFISSETMEYVYDEETDELIKTITHLNDYVVAGPAALKDAKIEIVNLESGYPVSALAYAKLTNNTRFSKAYSITITKSDGTAWTAADGVVSIRYEVAQFGSNTFENVDYGAAYLYADGTMYSAEASELNYYEISDVVYTNSGTATIVFEHMPIDFIPLNYKGYYTTEQVNVYDNTLSTYTTITATESVKVLYSFTQLIYKEVTEEDEEGNTVTSWVVDQEIPWYWIDIDGQYLFVRQESITFESEQVIDTKLVFKSWVTEVDVYLDPATDATDYVTLDVSLFDGVYKVSGTYYDKEEQVLLYQLECCEHFSWPEGYEEYRYVIADYLEETDRGIAHPIVDFCNPAPIMEIAAISPFMLRSTPGAALAAYGLTRAASSGNGLEMSKVVKDNKDGTYTITLEAYTTGTVTVTQTTKPMDIVLVIDQSGSMAYCIECNDMVSGSNDTHTKYKYTATYSNNSGTRYISVGGSYQSVYYCNGNGGYSHVAGWYTTEHNWSHGGTRVEPKTSDIDTNSSHVQFYTRSQDGTEPCTRRYDALITALNTFVTAVTNKSIDENGNPINHRIAIVGFSSDGYNNTELLTGVEINTVNSTNLNNNTKYYPDNRQYNGVQYGNITDAQYAAALQDMSTTAGQTNVQDAIDALTAHGGTQTLDGMDMAYEILANKTLKDEDREEVVILFTDGATNSDRGDLLNKAYNIKHDPIGATIYSIGIFDGANGNLDSYTADIADDNSLMHLISSNYPDAQYTSGYNGGLSAGNPNTNLTGDTSYYLSASNADSLNGIFQSLSTQIGTTPMPLDSYTVVRDIITPQFTLPENATDVDVQQIPYLGNGQWDTDNAEALDNAVTIDTANHTVDVTGFDFTNNYVSETGRKEGDDTQTGDFRGRKLVITFTITPDPSFLGGDGVATNGEDSGIYKKNEDGSYTCVGNFISGSVDVPLKDIRTELTPKHIYYGNTVDLTGILDLWVDLEGDDHDVRIDVDGVFNAYVDLLYTIKLNDSTIATYYVPAGEVWGSDKCIWTDTTSTSATALLQNYQALVDTSFEVTCKMTSVNKTSNIKETQADKEWVYVYKPTLTFQDSIQKYKDALNLGTSPDVNSFLNAHYVGVTWSHTSQTATPEGEAPGFAFTFTYSNTNAFTGFVMNSTQDVPVSVTVTIKGYHSYKDDDGNYVQVDSDDWLTDLTRTSSNITFAHATCNHSGCKFNSATEEFIVHVIGALTSLTIKKEGWYSADPNQTYLFKITGKDADGNDINLTVTVHGNGSVTIYGLVIGNEYTVTELTDWSWRYQFSKWEHDVNKEDTADTTDTESASGTTNGALITIGEDGTITFTNTRTEEKWLDGDAWCDNLFSAVTTTPSDDEDDES